MNALHCESHDGSLSWLLTLTVNIIGVMFRLNNHNGLVTFHTRRGPEILKNTVISGFLGILGRKTRRLHIRDSVDGVQFVHLD